MFDERLEELRTEVAAAARRIAADGLVLGTAGNISARREDRIAVTPTGAALAAVRAEQITVVDRAGAVIGEGMAPSSELALHLGVYDRYDAGAVVHTHSPAATALACVLDDALPCIHYGMLALGGDVRVAPYRTFGTPELARVTVDALEGRTAALMASHGTVTYGGDIAAAVGKARLLEWAAQLYLSASVVGAPRVMDAAARQAVLDTVAEHRYGTLRPAGG